jgi:hypothetical protein
MKIQAHGGFWASAGGNRQSFSDHRRRLLEINQP